jgi:alpha-beta hydrolase superfamily lysophospholipase
MNRQVNFPLIVITLLSLLLFVSSSVAQTETPGVGREGAPVAGLEKTVQFDTTDGVTIVGSYYPQKRAGRPSILLLHMLGRNRTTVADTAGRLHEAGFNVLAIDLRGHGESTQGKDHPVRMEAFLSSDYAAMDQDVDAAVRYLREQLGEKHELAIVGGSIGANLAMRKGAADAGVAAVVLLSPSLDYRGIVTTDAIPRYKDRPILILTTERDTSSLEGAKKIAEGLSGEKEFKVLPGLAHGTALLRSRPEIEEEVIDWLKRHLKPSKGATPPGGGAGDARPQD